MIQITHNARQQHATFEDAERSIEVFCPAQYLYQIVRIKMRLPQVPATYAVKVFSADGPFLGFVYNPHR